MLNSPTAQNKRVFELRQDPDTKRKTMTAIMTTQTQFIKQPNKELQQPRHPQQRVITSACLPPNQKVHPIQLFKSTPDSSPQPWPKACLYTSMIDGKSSGISFLPPINPSSVGSLKKKKNNFISSAVAALANGVKGNTNSIFSRSTPNSRNSSPMRSRVTTICPGSKKCLDGNPRHCPDSPKNPPDFRKPCLQSKSSSNPALAEKQSRSSSHPSPTRQKNSSSSSSSSPSPSKKQSSKQTDEHISKIVQPQRRMSLPINKDPSQMKSSQPHCVQTSKQEVCVDHPNPNPSDIWQPHHCAQHSEPSADSFPLVNPNFIHSQRVLSRVKSSGKRSFEGDSLNLPSDDEKSEKTRIVNPVMSLKKENIYEEIDSPMKSEIRHHIPITMTTSCYQSPSLSSSSSSSSFFQNGKQDLYGGGGEQLERIRINQRSLDDGYSSQECQMNPANKKGPNSMGNTNVFISTRATIPNRVSKTYNIMTGSANDEYANTNMKLERQFSLDGKKYANHQEYCGHANSVCVLDNESSSDDCMIETKHSKDNDLPSFHNNITKQILSSRLRRPNNIGHGGQCTVLPFKKLPGQGQIGVYQTMPTIDHGSSDKCYLIEKGFHDNLDGSFLQKEDYELKRLRVLIWKERKNNEEREAEVERRWVARMEGVVAEARSIEQSLKNQLQQLRKQFVHLQDQLLKSQVTNRFRPPCFETSTQTNQPKESLVTLKPSREKTVQTDKAVQVYDSMGDLAPDESAEDSNFRQLATELENCKIALEDEQIKWMNEKNSVIEYQQRLQFNYIQAMKRNELLTEELHQLTMELQKLHFQKSRNEDK